VEQAGCRTLTLPVVGSAQAAIPAIPDIPAIPAIKERNAAATAGIGPGQDSDRDPACTAPWMSLAMC
jgi:hypothetical protein